MTTDQLLWRQKTYFRGVDSRRSVTKAQTSDLRPGKDLRPLK